MSFVFIHGLGQTPSSWQKVQENLAKDISIYTPSLSAIIQDKEVLYENLSGALAKECENMEQPLCICGISLGAVLALQYALDNPTKVKSLILIAPQYKMPKLLLTFQNFIFHMLPKKAFLEMGFSKQDTIKLSNSMKKIDFTSKLGQVKCPCCIICGKEDKSNQKAAKSLANKLVNAALYWIEGAGHEVNIDAPDKLADKIKAFWELE